MGTTSIFMEIEEDLMTCVEKLTDIPHEFEYISRMAMEVEGAVRDEEFWKHRVEILDRRENKYTGKVCYKIIESCDQGYIDEDWYTEDEIRKMLEHRVEEFDTGEDHKSPVVHIGDTFWYSEKDGKCFNGDMYGEDVARGDVDLMKATVICISKHYFTHEYVYGIRMEHIHGKVWEAWYTEAQVLEMKKCVRF